MDKAENKKRNQAFGQFARGLRENSNLSQAQVTEAFGAAERIYVSKLERGISNWQLWHVQKLADLLGLKLSELLRQFEAQAD